eukprot:TRINITY_DN12321_c1_g3_i1.p1 TRINITY_DN12321_c1_g3~~TRINITY_DN12321_c1_g3_i1.p1  ORF type:complete len:172 (+),score=21.39 TRINITY_DN12321_c1_g3_i1:2-517(+)
MAVRILARSVAKLAKPVPVRALSTQIEPRQSVDYEKIKQQEVYGLETEDLQDEENPIRITTRDLIHGYEVVEELGVVVGTSARSKSVFADILQRIRGVVGGTLVDYEELFANTTAEATHNAMAQAQQLGATAIVRTRYQSAATDSKLTGVSCFVICFGTAVRDVRVSSTKK